MAILKNTNINDTGFLQLPAGTTAQRPASPANGMVRYNTSTSKMEAYIGGLWYNISANVLPVTSGLVGWYLPSTWTGSSWPDSSGNNNNATTYRGTINTPIFENSALGATSVFPVLSGNTSAGIRFPTTILPSTYTLFHVARYNSGTEGRIFDGYSGNNWLSGFWNGNSGVAYHEGWITTVADYHGVNWVISTDQNSRYRSKSKNANSGNFYNWTGGGGQSTQLSINYGTYTGGEVSDWMVAEIIVYNRTLSDAEITTVESYLSTKFGI